MLSSAASFLIRNTAKKSWHQDSCRTKLPHTDQFSHSSLEHVLVLQEHARKQKSFSVIEGCLQKVVESSESFLL